MKRALTIYYFILLLSIIMSIQSCISIASHTYNSAPWYVGLLSPSSIILLLFSTYIYIKYKHKIEMIISLIILTIQIVIFIL